MSSFIKLFLIIVNYHNITLIDSVEKLTFTKKKNINIMSNIECSGMEKMY